MIVEQIQHIVMKDDETLVDCHQCKLAEQIKTGDNVKMSESLKHAKNTSMNLEIA